MSRELPFDDALERRSIAALVRLRDSTDLARRAVAQDGADGELVGALAGAAALHGAVQLCDVGFCGLRDDGRGFFLAVGGEDHAEEALCLEREVFCDVLFQHAVVGGVIGALDFSEVSVFAAQEHVVEHALVCADAFEGLVEGRDVVH